MAHRPLVLRRPYLVRGGHPQGDSWVFFTPAGRTIIDGHNDTLRLILPLLDGEHGVREIVESLPMFAPRALRGFLRLLARHGIVVDANRVYQGFRPYSLYPPPFAESLTQEENVRYYFDRRHLPPVHGRLLPAPEPEGHLADLLRRRTSSRIFSGEAVPRGLVLDLMWALCGRQDIRGHGRKEPLYLTFTVPSGGGLYPLTLYLFVFRPSAGLCRGLFLWHKERSRLEILRRGDLARETAGSVFGVDGDCLDTAAGMVCVAADFERSAGKYGNHAYDLVLLEAGHVMQNAYLFGAERSLGFVENYGFYADRLAALIGLDHPRVSPVITGIFGPLAGRSRPEAS